MCTGVEIGLLATAALASAGSAAVQSEAARKQRSQQDSDIAKGLERQEANKVKAHELLTNEINEFNPVSRNESTEAIAQETTDRLRNLVTPFADKLSNTSQVQGNVSPIFLDRADRAGQGENDRVNKLTMLLGKMQAPIQQRTNEGYRYGDYAAKLGELLRQNEGIGNAAQLSASNRQISPTSQYVSGGLDLLSSGAGYGASYSLGGGALPFASAAGPSRAATTGVRYSA